MESLMETSNDSYVCSHLQNSSQAANLHLNEKVAKIIPERLYTFNLPFITLKNHKYYIF